MKTKLTNLDTGSVSLFRYEESFLPDRTSNMLSTILVAYQQRRSQKLKDLSMHKDHSVHYILASYGYITSGLLVSLGCVITALAFVIPYLS